MKLNKIHSFSENAVSKETQNEEQNNIVCEANSAAAIEDAWIDQIIEVDDDDFGDDHR